MADHDQRMKTAVKAFPRDFVALFDPAWPPRLVFSSLEWLEQEVFPDPPEGQRRLIDLLAKIQVKEPVVGSDHLLLHVEIESADSLTRLRRLMPRYHAFLRHKHHLAVLSVGLYLDVALAGSGWDGVEERIWGQMLATTRWPYLGLPGLEAMSYVTDENPLAVAFSALMRVREDRRAWLKATALQRIGQADLTKQQKYVLMEIVQTYLPLVGPHLQEYDRLLLTEEFTVARQYGETSKEIGRRETVREQLEARFGSLSQTARERFDAWPTERVREVSLMFYKAESLAELGLEDATDSARPS